MMFVQDAQTNPSLVKPQATMSGFNAHRQWFIKLSTHQTYKKMFTGSFPMESGSSEVSDFNHNSLKTLIH